MNTATHSVALSATLEEDNSRQWVHLLPRGRFAGRDGRGPWKAEDLGAVIRNTWDYAGKTLLAVDYDHQIDKSGKNGQPAPAAGWIVDLEAREDGLWGLVEWTEKAAAHIHAKEYRYLSPVFNYTPGTNEVKRLLRAGLTNNPALELTALASAQENPTMNEETLARLRELLGLDETADEQAIVQAVSELVTAQQSNEPDPLAFVPIEEFKTVVAELQDLRTRQTNEVEAKAIVDRAIDKGHIPPSMEKWGVAVCMSNRKAFEDFIQDVSPAFRALRGHQTEEWANPDVKPGRHGLSEEQLSICETMGIAPEDYAKQLGETG